MRPIYKPKGAAAEYADYALNIYTGCTNGCTYCYAPSVLRKTREEFECAIIRHGILDATVKQLSSGKFEGETIHLCFTCDPYPSMMPTMITREVIEAIKGADAHVQILTKNPTSAMRDFDLLDANDSFGITYTGGGEDDEPMSDYPEVRLSALEIAHDKGIFTWVSCEPVLDPKAIYRIIVEGDYIDLFKIGKLNHAKSPIDWKEFGEKAEALLRKHDRNYVIKKALRDEMEKGGHYGR